MKIVSETVENNDFKVSFKDELEDMVVDFAVSFRSDFKITNEIDNFQDRLSLCIRRPITDFPYDVKTDLKTFPYYIPNERGAFILRSCLEFFRESTKAPVSVGSADHPGFLMTTVTFNSGIIKPAVIISLVDSILEGIRNAPFDSTEIERKEEETEEDPLDNVDEENAIEYEFELDIQDRKLIKERKGLQIEELEGEKND